MRYPGTLDEAVAAWLAARPGSRREGVAGLSDRYKAGRNSAGGDLVAYVASRLPATFAANAKVFAEVAKVLPGWQPRSLLDIGAGPGTAGWAGLAQWGGTTDVTQVDTHASFLQLAADLNAASGLAALEKAKQILGSVDQIKQADLVLCSYMLAERPETDAAALAQKMWTATTSVLVLVEPGTPQGFTRLRLARERLIKLGANLVGPCCHAQACPMMAKDWCHFKVRVQRTREHMHAKGGLVPFEDEPIAWLAVTRLKPTLQSARVVAPVVHEKHEMQMKLCVNGEIRDSRIATRDKANFKRFRKVAWGDAVEVDAGN